LPSMRSWQAEFAAGRCNEVQSAYWKRKPSEEFYHIDSDPFEIRNLIRAPEHAARIAAMRDALRAEILGTRDTGFIPEGMFERLAGGRTIYDYAQSEAYPLERLLELADKASEGDSAHLPDLMAGLEDEHPLIRYWAATGCLILEEQAAPATRELNGLLADEWGEVRVVAAEAVAYLGGKDAALRTIATVLKSSNPHEALAAQNALEFMWKAGHAGLEEVQNLVRDLTFSEPGDRIPGYLLSID
jgi:N-sulfoglucosamine sulfohydrolase